MPARDHHIAQARHNAKFYATVDKSAFKDWAITVLFYTGLHYIDAFLDQKANIHPNKHQTRDNAVARVTELKPIYGNYSALKNASFNARYTPPIAFTDKNLDELENVHLAKIKAALNQYVSL